MIDGKSLGTTDGSFVGDTLGTMVGVIEGFRSALLNARQMPWDFLAIGAVSATVIFVSGAYYFRSKERLFADVA